MGAVNADFPYASRRPLLLADNGVVATSQPLAAQAGLRMLIDGGNAVDAALAAAIALTVVEPTSNGIGGDAFAIVWDGERAHGINGCGRAPAALSAAAMRDAGYREVPGYGWLSVTVPGAVAAWEDLHRRFGRLDWRRLFAPAIGYAESGFAVTPVVSAAWHQAAAEFLVAPGCEHWAQVFAPRGRAPRVGERWASGGHARGLRSIAADGAEAFYCGAIGASIVAQAHATGGLLDAADLAVHRSEWVEPIGIDYRGTTVWELPPNGQGVAALAALGMLDGLDPGTSPGLDERSCHLAIEAMKLALADAYQFVGDPECVAVPTAGLLAPRYLDTRRALIGERARVPEPGAPADAGTVYLAAADRDGMMVSLIQSNYAGFGSGVVVPEYGVALHNRGACFTLEPGHRNEAAGGRRPRHTILPAFLTRAGTALGPFGVMGGEMQPQGHLQVVTALTDQGLNAQSALDLPRWRAMGGLEVMIEPGFPAAVGDGLRARGHEVRVADGFAGFGRGQILLREPAGHFAAGSDWRADGIAVGW